ncbi:hypothetical protein SNE40_003381 [Patella caerulea]|uniref:Cytochrome b561 domain-containing protein n=1 Tax=Patella caerulea TaxID=87958 RepID=A0AAN8KAL3_PATCE
MKIAALIIVLLSKSVEGQLKWERLDRGIGDAPSPRRDMGFGYDAVRDRLVLFGGKPGPLQDTWIYEFSTGKWRMVTVSSRPPARFSMVSGVSGDFFYIATGEGKNKEFFSDIWRFDLRLEVWEEIPTQSRPDFYSQVEWQARNTTWIGPEPRYGAAGGIYANGGEQLYVALGFSTVRYHNTYSYDTRQLRWHLEYCRDCNSYNPSYPHARCLHAGTMIDKDEMVIFGGCLGGGGSGGPCPAGDSWLFNGKSKYWKRLPDCASPRMYGVMANLPSAVNRRRVVLYGGLDKSDQVIRTNEIKDDQVAVYDPDSNSWSVRKTLPFNSSIPVPSWRASVGMATGKNGIYMFGGINKMTKNPMNDLWVLRGDVTDADKSEQLECTKYFMNYITVHGILMAIGWGFFLQWGAFIARYLKCKNPIWFYLHVTFQIFGLCCAIAGLVMGILSVPFGHVKFVHSIVGIVVMILGVLQPINALIRPHKTQPDESKTFRRRLWECVHHFGGRAGLILALVNISLGVFLAVTDQLIWSLWFGYLCAIVLVYILAESIRGLIGRSRNCKGEKGTKQPKHMLDGYDNDNYKHDIYVNTTSADTGL